MSVIRNAALGLLLTTTLSGCIRTFPSALPTNAAGYKAIARPASSVYAAQYPLQAGDKVRISVFQEPDLSADLLLIDPAGNLNLPLVGEVHAAGLTSAALTQQIATTLGRSYLRNPQVSVSVIEAVDRTVSIEGEVKQPGVYAITPQTTLLSALSMARSPTNIAKLDEVVIFRTVDGQRMGGRFDVALIRAGRAEDPQVLPNDIIMVGYSRVQGGYRDLLSAAPLIGVMTRY